MIVNNNAGKENLKKHFTVFKSGLCRSQIIVNLIRFNIIFYMLDISFLISICILLILFQTGTFLLIFLLIQLNTDANRYLLKYTVPLVRSGVDKIK